MRSLALRQLSRLFMCAILTMGLVIGLAALPGAPPDHTDQIARSVYLPAAMAQRVQIDAIWQQIYQDIPDIPLENEYVNKDTGDVSTNNTLLSRLIRYHIYTKGRPTAYRLDWKLTLADYLGVNECIDAETYPSGTSLRINPLDGDIVAVQSLNRTQRDALVNTLARLFNPRSGSEPVATPSPTPTPAPSPVSNPPRFPPQPQPGDAQLLQP